MLNSFQKYSLITHRKRTKFQSDCDRLREAFRLSGVSQPGVRFSAEKIRAQASKIGVIGPIVHQLRLDGEPICSDAKGYWYSDKPEDLKFTIGHLEQRAHECLRVADALAKHLKESI